jgi:hypothetical protein
VAKAKKAAPNGAPTLHLHVDNGSASTSELETDAEEFAQLDAMEEGGLSRAIEEIRHVEGAKAEVRRIAPPERVGYCRSYPVSVFSLERIGADWGPGKYRVQFKGPGDKYIRGGGAFDIAEGLQPAGPSSVPGTGVQDLLALFKAQDEKRLADREKHSERWFKWASLLAPILGPKVLELFGGSKGTSLADMIRAVKDLKELQAPTQDLNSQFGQVVQILEGARAIIGDNDIGSKTGSTWVDLIRDLANGPAAAALAGAIPRLGQPVPGQHPPLLPQQAPVASVSSVQPPASVSASTGAPAGPVPSNSVIQQLHWLRETLGQLVAQATKKANPRLYVEVVLDNLPPFITPKELLERMAADDCLKQLQQLDPRITPHLEWFTKFRDMAVRVLERQLRREATQPAPESGPIATPLPGKNEEMPQEQTQFE